MIVSLPIPASSYTRKYPFLSPPVRLPISISTLYYPRKYMYLSLSPSISTLSYPHQYCSPSSSVPLSIPASTPVCLHQYPNSIHASTHFYFRFRSCLSQYLLLSILAITSCSRQYLFPSIPVPLVCPPPSTPFLSLPVFLSIHTSTPCLSLTVPHSYSCQCFFPFIPVPLVCPYQSPIPNPASASLRLY